MDEHATEPLDHKTDWSPYPALMGVAAPLFAVAVVLRSLPLFGAATLLSGVAVGGWLREAGTEHQAGRGGEQPPDAPQDALQRAPKQTLFATLALVPLAAAWAATARMLAAHDLLTGDALLELAAPAGRALPVAMTIIMIAAPLAAQIAAAWRRDPSRMRLVTGAGLSALLALAFLTLLVVFSLRLRAAGVVPSTSVAASALYWLGGLAGAQALVAGLFSGVIAVRGALGTTPSGHRHAEAVTIVWAFSALAWVAILALLLWA